MPTTIAIADDHQMFLAGMRLILERYDDLQLLHTATDGEALLAACAREAPSVVLLDLKMPRLDGVATLQRLVVEFPKVRTILLTLDDSPSMIQHLMELGANGYLLKNERPEELYRAIMAVKEKGYYFNDYVGRALLNGKAAKKTPATTIHAHRAEANLISPREREVLHLICQQQTTAEIAKTLFITPRTVEGHRKNLLEKTGTRNVAGLVVYAMRHGLGPDPN